MMAKSIPINHGVAVGFACGGLAKLMAAAGWGAAWRTTGGLGSGFLGGGTTRCFVPSSARASGGSWHSNSSTRSGRSEYRYIRVRSSWGVLFLILIRSY
jgi:hypothetical protein